MPFRWSDGVLEYWMVKAKKITLFIPLNPVFQYSITPILHYSLAQTWLTGDVFVYEVRARAGQLGRSP